MGEDNPFGGWHSFEEFTSPPRPLAEIKRDIDKKFKEITKLKKKLEAENRKIEQNKSMTYAWKVKQIEVVDRLKRDIATAEKEMEKLELDAYSTWIPRARIVKLDAQRKAIELEQRKQESRRRGREKSRNKRRGTIEGGATEEDQEAVQQDSEM